MGKQVLSGDGESVLISGQFIEVGGLDEEQAALILESGLCDPDLIEEIHKAVDLTWPMSSVQFLSAYCRLHRETFGEVLVVA